MYIRHLQRTGGASFTVTLPKPWINQYNLRDKSPIEIHTQASGALLVRINPTAARRPAAVLSIKNHTEEMITRETLALYIAGVDEIEFSSPSFAPKQRAHIRTVAQRLIGFEIIEESSTKILVRNVFDLTKLPVPDMVEKMLLATRSMLADALAVVTQKDESSAKDIIDRDLEIDKLYLIINRQFHSVLDDEVSEEEVKLNRTDINYLRTIALQLERIADHAVKIAEVVSSATLPAPHTYHRIGQQLLDNLELTRQMVREVDLEIAHHLLNTSVSLERAIAKQRGALPETSTNIIVADSLDRTRSYIMNTAEATIDHAIRRRTRNS